MACQVLEVTLISAKDLKRVTVFSKMRVYAVASISGGGPRLPTHRTYADREGGRNPMWHAPLRFTIPRVADPHALALHVMLRTERAFGDCDVGEVSVPVQNLAAAAPEGGEQRHLSYQVRRPMSGRKRGVLHISYRLTDVPAATDAAAPYVPQYVQEAAKRQQQHNGGSAVTAYPAAERRPPPYHQHAAQYVPPYGGPYPHHQPYGYGAAPHGALYGYVQGGTAPAATARHDGAGMGAGLGLGLLGGAVGGLMLGDMAADAEVMDGVGF